MVKKIKFRKNCLKTKISENREKMFHTKKLNVTIWKNH